MGINPNINNKLYLCSDKVKFTNIKDFTKHDLK